MRSLDFSIDSQECSEWCWAAVTSAIGRFYQDAACPKLQCGVVNEVLMLGQDCCTDCDCKNDPFDACNQPQNLGVSLGAYHLGRDGINGVAGLNFSDIQSEIDSVHPIAVSITLNDPAASGHAVVIYGYADDEKIMIADPMHADTIITASFQDLITGTDSGLHGQWQAGFRTKRRDE